VPLLLKYDPRFGNTTAAVSKAPMTPLQTVLYHGCNIFGWAIRAKNVPVITYLFRKGVNPNKVVDGHPQQQGGTETGTQGGGNSAVHYAVLHGNLMVVDTVLNAHDEILHLEEENAKGMTAAMLAAQMGSYQVTKKLVRCGCSGRAALRGKYWGWLLAMVREREKHEMNTQTGIYGEDDDRYFSNSPDPTYLVWGWK
jgi:uncharacterized glyoxalase superfamily protein PhnB